MDFLIVAALYFLPALLAHGKPSFAGILLFNLLLGWTGIGWIVALAWSLGAAPGRRRPVAYCCSCGAPTPAAACPQCGRAWA